MNMTCHLIAYALPLTKKYCFNLHVFIFYILSYNVRFYFSLCFLYITLFALCKIYQNVLFPDDRKSVKIHMYTLIEKLNIYFYIY